MSKRTPTVENARDMYILGACESGISTCEECGAEFDRMIAAIRGEETK